MPLQGDIAGHSGPCNEGTLPGFQAAEISRKLEAYDLTILTRDQHL